MKLLIGLIISTNAFSLPGDFPHQQEVIVQFEKIHADEKKNNRFPNSEQAESIDLPFQWKQDHERDVPIRYRRWGVPKTKEK